MTEQIVEVDVTDEFDRPLGGLEGMRRIRFDRTQMEGAAAEIRFLPG